MNTTTPKSDSVGHDTEIYRYFYTVSTVPPPEFYTFSLKIEVKHFQSMEKTTLKHNHSTTLIRALERSSTDCAIKK